tara:strand:+ start:56 stop:472 length:417 start_codon:yes stop_codon:yes gene_type:complete
MEIRDERLIELVKNHLDISISHDINDFDNVDCMIYEESTADGYSVYLCTNDNRYPSICEDVYYYNHELSEAFEQQVRWNDKTFYICEDVYEDSYMNDMLLEMFTDHAEDIIKNDELDITLEEINYLKEEYGITEEVED